MRLSTEIALGSLLLRPVAGVLNTGDGGGCAFGMAGAANGMNYYDVPAKPWLLKSQSDILPCDCGKDGSQVMTGMCAMRTRKWSDNCYQNAIVHLFNYHVCTAKDWSLEQLIDWVRSVEPAEPDETEELIPTTQVIEEALAELVTT